MFSGGSEFSKMLKMPFFSILVPQNTPKSFVDPKLMHFLFWQYIWHKIRHYQALRYRKIKNGNEKRIFLLKFCSFSCIFNFWADFHVPSEIWKLNIESYWNLITKPPYIRLIKVIYFLCLRDLQKNKGMVKKNS